MEDITKEISGDIVTNRINLSRATVKETGELRNILDEQITIGHFKIVIDLSQCTHLDTTFIGALVVTHKKLLAKGGELKIVNPLDPAKELFRLTGISKVFDTFETSNDAVMSFSNRIKPLETKSDNIIPKKKVASTFE